MDLCDILSRAGKRPGRKRRGRGRGLNKCYTQNTEDLKFPFLADLELDLIVPHDDSENEDRENVPFMVPSINLM